jgi:hypothetical protein
VGKQRSFGWLVLLAASTIFMASAAFANTIHVNDTSDVDDDFDGKCTLRQAIRFANTDAAPIGGPGECDAASGNDTIDFSVSGTIILGSILPDIVTDMTIDGSGQNITINGDDMYRVFYVDSATLTLKVLTIINGLGDSGGGAILNFGSVDISDTTFQGNFGTAEGGAIENWGPATIRSSTFNANGSSIEGGAISCNAGYLNITNSTFQGNGSAFGGGIVGNCSTNLYNCTISGNFGGGVLTDISDAISLYNTIIVNNNSGDCLYDPAGNGVTADSFNIDSDDTCDNATTSANTNLGALNDNGGLTKTMALLTGSSALDAGDDAVCLASPVDNLDQRGVTRPQSAHCDTGAFEAEQGFACAHSAGFWKKHPAVWPVSSLTLGSQLYTSLELQSILASSKTKDASIILAYQLIAAKINVANGSGASIQPVIDDSDALLAGFGGKLPYNVKSSSTLGQQMVSLAKELEVYNLTQTINCTP